MSASNAIPLDINVSNFVSVKLSGKHNYFMWKAQVLCLLNSSNMYGILDDTFIRPRYSGPETLRQYDNLVKGWIFGSVSEDVLVEVFSLDSAKAVWEKLQSNYDSTLSSQRESSSEKSNAKTDKEDRDDALDEEDTNSIEEKAPTEMETKDNYTQSSESEIKLRDLLKTPKSDNAHSNLSELLKDDEGWEIQSFNVMCMFSISIMLPDSTYEPYTDSTSGMPADAKTEIEDTNSSVIKIPTEVESENEDTEISEYEMFKSAILKGDWPAVRSMLTKNEDLAREAISSDGSTGLHIAVGIGYNNIVQSLLHYMRVEHVFKRRNSDGSTALHIAAIVGNTHAASLLVKVDESLLRVDDNNRNLPLDKAYENMHLGTVAYLLETIEKSSIPVNPLSQIAAVNLVVNAISAKQYSLALEFFKKFPKSASSSEEVLMAIAKNFPSGLNDWEEFIYPSLENILEMLRKNALVLVSLFYIPAFTTYALVCNGSCDISDVLLVLLLVVVILILIGPILILSVIAFIPLLILIVCFLLCLLYYLCWKGAKILAFPPIKRIENKIKEQDEAKTILVRVCDEIDKLNYSGLHHPCYTRPIIEAACQNAYKVVDEILSRYPEAIKSKDISGYDIIQLAILNRSEKIYNFIYDVDEHKNIYRTYKDSSKNNILHLAGKLAPSNVLNQRTGAALQLQRELQWCQEVKKLVIPTYITQENVFKETPDMVFTEEHKDLVKQGEQWMKTTAESCSITAALITTIVFAAAITVPGGSDQEKGTPLFKKETAFIIFAISDAISLFASTTTLLVFLSILTTRFAEKDFLVSLPKRLFIGLFFLFLSTIAMMVAFSATLFLVFCEKKLWMLAPICVLAFIPIAFFVTLQFPLMVDLFWSTYIPIFGKERLSILRRYLPVDTWYLIVMYVKYVYPRIIIGSVVEFVVKNLFH